MTKITINVQLLKSVKIPVKIPKIVDNFSDWKSFGIRHFVIWGFSSNYKFVKVFKLQKKAVQGLVDKEYAVYSDPIFSKLEILKLNDILKFKCICTDVHLYKW